MGAWISRTYVFAKLSVRRTRLKELFHLGDVMKQEEFGFYDLLFTVRTGLTCVCFHAFQTKDPFIMSSSFQLVKTNSPRCVEIFISFGKFILFKPDHENKIVTPLSIRPKTSLFVF